VLSLLMTSNNLALWRLHRDKVLGVLFALTGNSFTSLSLCIQKKVHLEKSPKAKHFLFSLYWWLGLLFMGLGELGNFSAFAFVSASIVAPLGAWSVVLNAFFACWFLHESLDFRKFLGMLCCLIGGVLLVIYGPSGKVMEAQLDYRKLENLLWRPTFLIYLSFIILSLLVTIFICWYTPIGNKYVIGYVTVCALLGAIIVMSSKCLSILLRLSVQGDYDQLWNKLFLCSVISLICFIPIQILFINSALQRFTNSQVVPVYYVLFTLSSIVSCAILFNEFRDDLQVFPFLCGIGQTFIGVFLLNASSPTIHYATMTTNQELRNLQLLDSFLRFRSYLSYSAPGDEFVARRWYRKDSDYDIQPARNDHYSWKQSQHPMVPLETIVSNGESNLYQRHLAGEECPDIETMNSKTNSDLILRKRTCGIALPDSTVDHVRVQAEQIRNRHRAASWADKEWFMEEDK